MFFGAETMVSMVIWLKNVNNGWLRQNALFSKKGHCTVWLDEFLNLLQSASQVLVVLLRAVQLCLILQDSAADHVHDFIQRRH